MKTLMGTWVLLLSACASAPQPHCMPPSVTRVPEASGGFGPVPNTASGAEEEYARCKEREAERLERELRETQGQDKQEPQTPDQDE